jgi:hypothetical protein
MVIGGFCPGTAAGAIATGRVDALVFVVGFLAGSLVFGDLFPVWGDFYESDFRGVFRLDELFGIGLGPTILLMIAVAIAGSLLMRAGQRYFWGDSVEPQHQLRCLKPLVLAGLVVGGIGLSFYPTAAYLPEDETVSVPTQDESGPVQSSAAWLPPMGPLVPSAAPPGLITDEGC